ELGRDAELLRRRACRSQGQYGEPVLAVGTEPAAARGLGAHTICAEIARPSRRRSSADRASGIRSAVGHRITLGMPSRPTFEWTVDPEFARQANRFIQLRLSPNKPAVGRSNRSDSRKRLQSGLRLNFAQRFPVAVRALVAEVGQDHAAAFGTGGGARVPQ